MLSWTIGTVLAVFATGWMPVLPDLPASALGGIGLLLGACLWRGTARGFLLGLLCGGLYAQAWASTLLAERWPPALDGEWVVVRGTVTEPPAVRRYSDDRQRQRFAFRAAEFDCPGAGGLCPHGPRRILLNYYGQETLRAGQRWQFEVRLKRPWGLANPGSFNYQSWLARHRFAATGSVRDASRQYLGESTALNLVHQRWRQQIADTLHRARIEESVSGLLLALSNGDGSAIGHDNWQRIRGYGLNHLLVISGLHVGMVSGLGFLLGSLLSRGSGHLAAAALGLAYAAAAGFALPTVRALSMVASLQLLALCHRRIEPLRSLVFALLPVALLDPLATHSAGFWLSYGAVATIFYLRIQWPALATWQFLLAMQLLLSALMGMLASFWFGGVSLVAPLANLVAIPVISAWVVPLCLLASVSSALGDGFAAVCWQLAGLPLQAFLVFTERLSDLGFSPLVPARPALMTLLAGLAGSVLLVAHRALPVRLPALCLLGLVMFAGAAKKPPSGLQLTALDVGQGLAVVLRTAAATILYDTGAGDPSGPNMASAVILPYFQRVGINALDLLVISHGDRDHAAGLETIRDAVPVDTTWFTAPAGSPSRRQFPCRSGRKARFGELRLKVLHPGNVAVTNSNNSSCVLLVEYGDARILLPGDIEASVERALVQAWGEELRAGVLVVPHHGSKTSSSTAFIRGVDPALAIVSRGYANRFGHPHRRVLARYRGLDVDILDTAHDGALTLAWRDGAGPTVARWREQRRFYWQ